MQGGFRCRMAPRASTVGGAERLRLKSSGHGLALIQQDIRNVYCAAEKEEKDISIIISIINSIYPSFSPPRGHPRHWRYISFTNPTSKTLSIGTLKFAIFVLVFSLIHKKQCNNPLLSIPVPVLIFICSFPMM